MKSEFDKEKNCYIEIPETPLEALQQLETFFEADMWYAKGSKEWKTEEDMIKYLRSHFNICEEQIKRLMGESA